uniref:Uncharacterized protein n=1 Tax=Chromera velia CCMP2878 TaxID=1169474 RepID=A0A0G4FKK3_9ALVE|eukprot:Cvel_401.t1-p1 / transcript=Cvel_401.t1 / gene=Cvel_401 / organism=Chromera_velia_CCMP2878 / gene_product=hypothetical protein / transcript_product=hypothetical protein / location=Cvel_scaffold13:30949-35722(-) / protein_length=319 / sequence_SO=supercontig / SO=protein_coding / is_pseudo=false
MSELAMEKLKKSFSLGRSRASVASSAGSASGIKGGALKPLRAQAGASGATTAASGSVGAASQSIELGGRHSTISQPISVDLQRGAGQGSRFERSISFGKGGNSPTGSVDGDDTGRLTTRSDRGFSRFPDINLSRKELHDASSKALSPAADSSCSTSVSPDSRNQVSKEELQRVQGVYDYLKSKLEGLDIPMWAASLCLNFAETLRLYLTRMEALTASDGANEKMATGEPMKEYLQEFNYGRVAGKPLLRQMVSWFDVCNVAFFLAFLAHVYLLDDMIPLRYWGEVLSEGIAKGTNVNKCVRNLLKIRKYRLEIDRVRQA